MTHSSIEQKPLAFLNGGGEMGALIRGFDWDRTPLGAPISWPQGLKTAVRLLLSSRHPVFIWWGPELIQLYNDAYRHSIGSDRHPGALGQAGRTCWAEIWSTIGPQIEQVMDGGDSTWHENQLLPITRGSQQEDVFWTYGYSPIDEVSVANGVGGVLVLCTETTPVIMRERLSGSARDRLEHLFAHAPSFMAMLRGPEHRFELANAAYMQLVGRQDLLGKTVDEVLPSVASQGYIQLLDEVYRTGRPYVSRGSKYATESAPGAGSVERYLDFIYQPVTDATGAVFGIFVEGADVTARVLAEAALHQLNQTLEHRVTDVVAEREILANVVESTEVLIQVLGLDFRILAINKANIECFEKGYGIRLKVGDDLHAALSDFPEHQAALKACWIRALGGEQYTLTGQFGDPTRNRGSYEMKFSALRDHQGKQYGASCIATDVTEKLQNHARLIEAEEKAHQAQRIDSLGQLTGGVAHDFNNLLMILSGGLDMLERPSEPARREKIRIAMRHAVERGARLSRQLLAFARRQPLLPEAIHLGHQLQCMLDLLERTLQRDIVIHLEFPPDLWPVEVDPCELELAVLNLIVNARDAMPSGGKITLSAINMPGVKDGGLRGDFVRLAVSDTGTGIAPDVLGRVFEPFFTTKDVGKGSGLGLAQTHGFAKASGGGTSITTLDGAGTTVSLLLPRTQRIPAKGQQRSQLVMDYHQKGSAGVALVVEDDDAVAALTTSMIEQIGYETHRVARADLALQLLAAGQVIDLVFSDVMMPGEVNGTVLAEEIFRLYPGMPVVLTSGHAEGISAEPKDKYFTLLPKPFRLSELANVLAAARAESAMQSGAVRDVCVRSAETNECAIPTHPSERQLAKP